LKTHAAINEMINYRHLKPNLININKAAIAKLPPTYQTLARGNVSPQQQFWKQKSRFTEDNTRSNNDQQQQPGDLPDP
jgi:hypothetical protein